ncbi:DEAD/DEAH box helicase [Collinsella tanakaei]|uniref:DEAD/DEAH box helicase n=1 Tax=Collinsella tanakaei TaxID=626935 RepID=UPI0025A4C34F|nr:DEAD/DEAH box helicase [Collinsella tanakaei]MDM8300027.1 DEAD/DEAH box helicase [Collinsella tanakaei]
MSSIEQNSVTFADLGLSETVLAAVADMGYEEPTPVQAAAIPEVLAGRDLLAAAQTGTGKTAAFLLPVMDRLPHVVPPVKKGERGRRRRNAAKGRGPAMLVITPTRELAQQIEEVCRAIAARTGHVAVTVVGGVGYVPQKQALARGCDILVATPGRLVDLIDQESANLDEVGVLVLDEADRMLDMGFLPQVRRIVDACRTERQTLLFSATLDESRVGAITDLVRDPARVEIAPVTSTADTVDQYVLPVSLDAKNGALTAVLKKEGPERAIVFVRTKRRADTCARRLGRAGITCGTIHGDRSQAQRERALQEFREGKVQVLVATDVLARGIDITDVRYVVNFDVPEEPTDYIHRIGRTGRAGEEGWSLTFVTPDDVDEFYDIEALMGKTADLYDAGDIRCGEEAPEVDPDRVPAAHVPSKKAKKRRNQRAKKATKRERVREPRQRAPRQRDIERRAARDAAREAAGEAASRPAARKRPGRVRVHAEEGVAATSPAETAVPKNRAERRAERFGDASAHRGRPEHAESRAARSGRKGASRSSNASEVQGRRSTRSGAGARGRDEAPERTTRDAWRNYDEGDSHGRGGKRSGRAGGRDNRTSMRPTSSGRAGRRPGDRGGKR